jgi:hypothetical protein
LETSAFKSIRVSAAARQSCPFLDHLLHVLAFDSAQSNNIFLYRDLLAGQTPPSRIVAMDRKSSNPFKLAEAR